MREGAATGATLFEVVFGMHVHVSSPMYIHLLRSTVISVRKVGVDFQVVEVDDHIVNKD